MERERIKDEIALCPFCGGANFVGPLWLGADPITHLCKRCRCKFNVVKVAKCKVSKPHRDDPPVPLFSGSRSRDMWNAINEAKSKEDLGDALYLVCCRIQELEGRLNNLQKKGPFFWLPAETGGKIFVKSQMDSLVVGGETKGAKITSWLNDMWKKLKGKE